MADNQENLNIQLAENIFNAIDVIATKRLEKVQFDKTLTCQIIDITDSKKGKYIVSDGVTDFVAYSENDSYSEGTWVYVSIPNGDFNQQKHIVGKYIADNTEYSTYRNPLDSYVDITGNLLDEDDITFGLIANNNAESQIVIWQIGEMSSAPYSSTVDTKEEFLAKVHQAHVDTETSYTAAKQRYDTELAAGTINQQQYDHFIEELESRREDQITELVMQEDDVNVSFKDHQLSCFDRLGIQASFKTYLNNYGLQSGSYGLRLYVKTRSHQAIATETNDQYITMELNSEEMFGNPYNFLDWSRQQYVFDISELDNIVGMTLVFYQNNDFRDGDGNFIPGYQQYKEDNITFTDEWKSYIALKNILVSDIYISLGYNLAEFDSDTVMLYTYDSLTYTSELNANSKKIIQQWNPIINLNTEEGITQGLNYLNAKSMYLRWIHIDSETDIPHAIDEIEDLGTWENEEGELSLAKIHWFHWRMEDGVTSELGGVFWEELNLNEIFANNNPGANLPTENTYDWFEFEEMVPNFNQSEERYKVVIEYPCKEYLEQVYNENIEEYIENNQSAWEEEIIVNLYADVLNQDGFPNLEQRSAINIELLKRIKAEQENYNKNLLEGYKLYTSPELVFTNEKEVPNKANVDLIQSLQLICDSEQDGGLQGTYNIYSGNGQLMNLGEAKKRIITAQFKALITGDEELDNAGTIKWFFPVHNSMIELPAENTEYIVANSTDTPEQIAQKRQSPIFAESAGLTDDGQWFYIERQGVAYSNRVRGAVVPTALDEIFRIKSHYSQTALNNTIRCEIYKNGKSYSADKTLYFGISGSNGTDYTLVAHLEEEIDGKWVAITTPAINWQGGRIKLVPQILDYDHKDVTAEYRNQFRYKLIAGAGGLDISSQGTDSNGNLIISRRSNATQSNFYHYIIQISVNKSINVVASNQGTLSVNLTTYYPIAVKFDNTYVNITGDNRVTYDYSGTNPIYHKSPYELYKLNEFGVPVKVTSTEGLRWSIVLAEDPGGSNTALIPYYPQIDSTSGLLIVPSMFMSGNNPGVSIIASINNTPVWCQPLYISQETYASTFLNSWNGALTIDNEKNTVMSAMIGAGFKNAYNQFNGVLMGQVGEKVHNESTFNGNVGLFGYNNGVQSFGLDIDGKAFFGKSGRGQIRFDGDTGTIKSGSYDDPENAGMLIDLDNAYINLRGQRGTYGTTNGNILVHLGVGANEFGDNNDDTSFLKISHPLNDLFVIDPGNRGMFLQSLNFNHGTTTNDPTSLPAAGVRFDLANGFLTGYDFKLTAKSDSGSIILDSTASSTPLRLGTENDFRVLWDGTVIANKFFAYSKIDNVEYFKVTIGDQGLTIYDGSSAQNVVGQFNREHIILQGQKSEIQINNTGINFSSQDPNGIPITISGSPMLKIGWVKIAIGSTESKKSQRWTKYFSHPRNKNGFADAETTTYKTNIRNFDPNEYRALGILGYDLNKGEGNVGFSYFHIYELFISGDSITVGVHNNSTKTRGGAGNYITIYLLLTPLGGTWTPTEIQEETEPDEVSDEDN